MPRADFYLIDKPRFREDPLLRLNAQRLGTEIAAMPSASEVVPLIERLARDGPPVLRY